MRLSFVLLFFLSFSFSVGAQSPCSSPQSQIDFWGNGLRTVLLGAADFGWDQSDAVFTPNYHPDSINPSTIFLAGLCYGGLDPGGNLRLKVTDYRTTGSTNNSSFFSGPLDPNGSTNENNCLNWDRFFRVSAADIDAFFDDLSDGSLDDTHNSVLGWPGRGNPFFQSTWGFNLPSPPYGLAPFYDADGDALYNPMNGDYPVVEMQGVDPFVPDLQVWQLINDQGGDAPDPVTSTPPLPAEIHITYFVFNCPDNPLLHNSLFTRHKIINRSVEPLDSMFIAMLVDFDLGCYRDDYLGSSAATNTFYTYNKTNEDDPTGACTPDNAYGINPPVQAVTFLNKSLDYFMPFYNSGVGNPPPGTTFPTNPNEYYNYLSGSWRDGTPLTEGATGYSPADPSVVTTNLAFPGNPNNLGEWSMLDVDIPTRDVASMGSHQLGTFQPGEITELVTAWSYHRGPGLNHLENVDLMLQEVPLLHDAYENNFEDVCSTSVSSSSISNDQSIILYPNPASGEVFLNWNRPQTGGLNVYDITGKLIYRKRISGEAMNSFNTGNWPEGMYFVVFSDGTTITSKKLEVLRSN